MKKNDPIIITPVGNGFEVVPHNQGAADSTNKETLVFEKLQHLLGYLDKHFDEAISAVDVLGISGLEQISS